MKDKLILNNKIFKDCSNVSPSNFYIYVTLSKYLYENNEDYVFATDIVDLVSVTKESIVRNLKKMVELDYLIEERHLNKNHYIKKYCIKSDNFINGETSINLEFLNILLKLVHQEKLSKRNFQVFLYLKYKEQEKKTAWKTSMLNLSKQLNTTQKNLMFSLKQLDENVVNYLQETYSDCFKYIYSHLR